MDRAGDELPQIGASRENNNNKGSDSELLKEKKLKDSADLLPDSVYFVNRQNKSKSSVVVLERDLGKESPLEWDEWTTNSDESSTISVVMQPVHGKTELINHEDDFQTSSSFEFQSKQKNEANEPMRENSTSRLKENASVEFNRKKRSSNFHETEGLEKEFKSYINISDSSPRNSSRNYSRDVTAHSESHLDGTQTEKHDYGYKNAAPKIQEPEPEPGEEKLRQREYSPSYRDLPRSRDSSASRFVAIDAYLGLKVNSSPDQETIKEKEKSKEREERREIRRIEMEVMEERRQKREMEREERRYLGSLERNKERGAGAEERRERSKGGEADKEIKEDLCSSLLTIKNASVSPEERRHSEVYLTGLKRLTAMESEPKVKQEKSYGSETDDSKSWYQSKLLDTKLSSDQAARLSPRSVTPVNREQEKSDRKSKSDNKIADASIPGFLTKTKVLGEEKKLEQDVHFDSEFPTFSAYLKRTYGQTYTYRTRESSETSEKGDNRFNNEEKNAECLDEPRKKDIEGDRVNDLPYEYSISDKASQKINEQQKCKDAEHISRKANFMDTNKDKPMGFSNRVVSSEAHYNEEANDTNSFLRRSKESIYESSGSAPSNSECFSKQLIKNSTATKSKSSKHENRDASPTIDLLKRSFESLQYALNNKDLELISPKACQDLRRTSPSPERTDLNERLSDSSQSRSRSRTKKRTVQSQSRSRDSSQKMRLKEIAPTYYEAKYSGGQDKRTLDCEDRIQKHEELFLSERGFHPQNMINKGPDAENLSHFNQKYAEKYPMDLNDEDISVMKKFIHHKKDELPSELFCMDVETFKKLYVQNRVMEMKREASLSRRSSITSNINDQEIQDRNQNSSGTMLEDDLPRPGPYTDSVAGAGRPGHESPKQRSGAVQVQVRALPWSGLSLLASACTCFKCS